MKLVIIESPYKGDRARNERYLRACIRDCFRRGEAAFASHRMYTDALDDDVPEERTLGIEAGLAWRDVRQPVWDDEETREYVLKYRLVEHVFYMDLGHTQGMLLAKARYDNEQIPYEERRLPADDPFFTDELEALRAQVRRDDIPVDAWLGPDGEEGVPYRSRQIGNSSGADTDAFRFGVYRHYKGGLYTALALVRHHHEGAPMVLYRSHGTGTINARPLFGWTMANSAPISDPDGWIDLVDGKPRFEFLGERAPECER